MDNTLSPPVATVTFSGFSIHCSLRGAGAKGGSSLTSLPFGRRSSLPALRHRFTACRHTWASLAASARRRSGSSSTTTRQGKASKKRLPQPQSKKLRQQNEDDDDEDIDEDAFEALFSMLEEDLKNDNLLGDDDGDDEITEKDLSKFEKELEEVLDDIEALDGDDDEEDTEDSEMEEVMPKLRNWQLRRLAAALKQGRRKTSIKDLATELGLDRALVLQLLREPPPDLLLMSASLPDKKPEVPTVETGSKLVEPPVTPEPESAKPDEPKETTPVHVLQSRWSMQKRLKKVQVETMERVYNRTKRPTNAMISSIVHVTNLPWKTVVKWFEDRRAEDGVPESRIPYHRSTT